MRTRTQRTEFEMEKILARHRAVARKHQIELVKYDKEIEWKPWSTSQYTIKERRKKVWQVLYLYIRSIFLNLKELRP